MQIEPIRNLFAALFLASIGMLVNVHFLWTHVDILLASVILVIIIKTTIVTTVVKGFGYNNKTALLVKYFVSLIMIYHVCLRILCASPSRVKLMQVGISLAQIGEFAFVLLSRASNLHLIEVSNTTCSSLDSTQ